jgi:hypothetical protein
MARRTRTHKVCTIWPEGGQLDALPRRAGEQLAVAQRVDNVRVTPLPGGIGVASAAVEKLKLWENGKTLRVRYLDGDPAVQAKVTAVAKEWEDVANLTLDFVTSGAAEIRISFLDRGFSWSTVGTDALTVPRTQPTMNYGWLTPTTSNREYDRVVLHEFGHALGMIHEHQNPAAQGQIPWDKPKVYAYYAQQGWSEADVDFNIFDVYDEDATNFTEYDPTSIMQYAIPDSLTVGSFSVGWNTALSDTDREFMERQYPAEPRALVSLTIDGDRVAADVSAGGEVDTYSLEVVEAATYIMTTEGPTDCVLTLHGPNDPGAVFAWDDDLGKERNARLVRKLVPGEYWITVRHKDPVATGAYDIGVTRRKD